MYTLGAQGIGTPKGGIQERGRATSNGEETETWEIICFKLYKSQLPVVEKALETVSLNRQIPRLLP